MPLVEIRWTPDAGRLRSFASAWLIGIGLFGLLAAWRTDAIGSGVRFGWSGAWLPPLLLWVAAIVGYVGAMLSRQFALWLYRTWTALTFPITWLVSHLLLGTLYYFLFLGYALCFRTVGRDALERKFERDRQSYWTPRSPAPGIDRYFKQF